VAVATTPVVPAAALWRTPSTRVKDEAGPPAWRRARRGPSVAQAISPLLSRLETDPADAARADERSRVAQATGHHPRTVGELEPASRIELGLRCAEERVTESQRDRTTDNGEGKVEQVDHRSDRSAHQRPGPPVMAASAVPDASASRQPWLPHGHGRPSGSTTMWPTCPAFPKRPPSNRPSNTMPPPTPVDTTMAM